MVCKRPGFYFPLIFILSLSYINYPFCPELPDQTPPTEIFQSPPARSTVEITKKQPQRRLVWADDFDSLGAPDTKKWSFETGYIRNNELQFYTNSRPENARIENGLLVIEARNDSFVVGDKKFPVTSASMVTKDKASWTYGRIEVKAKIPSSLGSWPAIWMLGEDQEKAGWPACGEIDIMENVGFDPELIHTNIHTKTYNHILKTNKGRSTTISKPYHDFHVYAIEWGKTKIDFFIDEKNVFTYENEGTGVDVWPFDKPFYLILNFAVGGTWGGQKGVDLTALPQQFLVDYVRVYQ